VFLRKFIMQGLKCIRGNQCTQKGVWNVYFSAVMHCPMCNLFIISYQPSRSSQPSIRRVAGALVPKGCGPMVPEHLDNQPRETPIINSTLFYIGVPMHFSSGFAYTAFITLFIYSGVLVMRASISRTRVVVHLRRQVSTARSMVHVHTVT
jgi:hypothetical protein